MTGAVLGRLARLLGGDSAVTLHPTGVPMPADAAIRVQSDPGYVSLYNAHYHETWPILPMLPQLPPAVFIDRMLVPIRRSSAPNSTTTMPGRRAGTAACTGSMSTGAASASTSRCGGRGAGRTGATTRSGCCGISARISAGR